MDEGRGVVSSRVNYVFAPQERIRWHSPRIYPTTNKVSPDHHSVGLTVTVVLKSPHVPKPKLIKTKKMVVKDVDEETILGIGEEAADVFSTPS